MQLSPPQTTAPSRGKLFAAFAAVYVIWGSTYFAIKVAIETLPPLLMAGTRFLAAGAILYVWARRRGAPPPMRHHWRMATLIGALLLVGGNGGVVWAEKTVPSGVTSLLVATVPLWFVLLDRSGDRRSWQVIAGVVLGFLGLAILIGPESLAGGSRIDPVGAGVLMVGTISWSIGSLLSRSARMPDSGTLATGMEMLAGGVLLFGLGIAIGELNGFDPGKVSLRSVLALFYLLIFGALIGFTAYLWLMSVASPSSVGTYAYVNPVVAMFLGWAVAGEPLTPRNVIATAVIVAAVLVVLTYRGRRREGEPSDRGGPPKGHSLDRSARVTVPAPTSGEVA